MTTYANGFIPLTDLRGVPAIGGQTAWLLPPAAESLLDVMDTIERRHAWECLVTSAGDGFRSYARQVAVFTSRYRREYSVVWQNGRQIVDRRVWDDAYARKRGLAGTYYRYTGAAAAIPGTSNHGKGSTADLSGLGGYGTTRFNQAAAILTAAGWSNAEGRSVSEPWHWTFLGGATSVTNTNTIPGVSIAAPTVTAPAPLTEPEDIMVSSDELNVMLDSKLAGLVTTGQLDARLGPVLDALDRAGHWVKFDGSDLAWLDLGVCRRRGTRPQYDAAGKPPIGVLPVTDPFWALPIIGDAWGEVYRRAGQEAAWLLEVDAGHAVRRWPARQAYVDAGHPPIVDLEPAHPFWSLPVIGALPPEGA